jgi:hypothetical protein
MPAVAEASAKLDYLAFLSQLLRPTHQHFLGGGFVRTFDQFHTPSQNLLHPAPAFLLAPVTSVQPQVREAREQLFGTIEQGLRSPPGPPYVGHVDFRL